METITLQIFGEDTVVQIWPANDGEDDRFCIIQDCGFRDGSPAFNAIESMILGHASAGVDITQPAYGKGIESAIEGIVNNDDAGSTNTNPPEPNHRIIAADTHEIEAKICLEFDYTDSLNAYLSEEEPMTVQEIKKWVIDDIKEEGIEDQLRNIENSITVLVKRKTEDSLG